MSWLAEQEPMLRLGAFFGVFTMMALWEVLAPRRPLQVRKSYRWLNNLGILAINTAIVRLLLPTAGVGVALFAQGRGWGLLNALPWSGWVEVLIAFVALDFAIWFQHWLFHRAPWLWRLHRMHHADLDFDITTGLRFHPGEIVLSMVIKAAVIVALGAPVLAVLIFEIVLNATSIFNHGNVRLPGTVDRLLRCLLVTPEMHRVHHSWRREETNSNYGFNLPWWDRLLGTYRAQPVDGHLGMTIGLEQFRSKRDLQLDRMLLQPLVCNNDPPMS